MPIDFDKLPEKNPFGLPEPGRYIATIKKAEMKTPKDPSRPDYLNMQLQLYKADGTEAGTLYDILTESASDIVRYKLQRFVSALGLDITGLFELKDLAKIIPNKRLIVDVTIRQEETRPDQAVVDVFKEEIYYPVSQASLLIEGYVQDTQESVPFEIKEDEVNDFPPSDPENSEDIY